MEEYSNMIPMDPINVEAGEPLVVALPTGGFPVFFIELVFSIVSSNVYKGN